MATLAQSRALVRMTVNHATVGVASATMLLEAIRLVGRRAPTLCLDERHAAVGACPMCLVGAARARGCSCTSCAFRSGGVSARAARCRVRSRGRRAAAASMRMGRPAGGCHGSTCVSYGALADTYPTDAVTERTLRAL